jgi:PilZ domain
MQTGRTEHRMATNTVASLQVTEEAGFNETVVLVNISEHGARCISRRSWPVGKRVVVSDALLNYRTTAEVVYCTPHSSRRFAVGVKIQLAAPVPRKRRGRMSRNDTPGTHRDQH